MADRLPDADAAVVDSAKLTEYLLSFTHPVGRAKAEFFGRFGFARERYEMLRAALLAHGASRPIVETHRSEHGVKYVVQCSMKAPDGREPCIFSVWIVDAGRSSPRLVTAYPG